MKYAFKFLVLFFFLSVFGCGRHNENLELKNHADVTLSKSDIPPSGLPEPPDQLIKKLESVRDQHFEPLASRLAQNKQISVNEALELVKLARSLFFPHDFKGSSFGTYVPRMITQIELPLISFSSKVADPKDGADPAVRVLLDEVFRFLNALTDTLMTTPNRPDKGGMLSIGAGTPEGREEVLKRQIEAGRYSAGAGAHRFIREPLLTRLLPALEKRLLGLEPSGREVYANQLEAIKQKCAKLPKVGEESKTP